jgi:PAS domain S-box-containing protein
MAMNRNPFSASRVPIDDYPELIVENNPLLSHAIWMILVGALVYIAMLLASPDEYHGRVYSVAGLVVLSLASQGVLRYRGTVPTVRLLAIGGWLLVTLMAANGEGVRGPILIAYPIILVFSGWMLGARYAVELLIASTIAVILMVLGEQAGFVGGIRPATSGMVAVAHVFVLAICTAMTIYLLNVFRRRYAEECRLNDENRLHLKTLERRESYQRALLDNFPFMVWLKDEDGRYLAVNQAFLEGFGWPSAETVVGKTDLDIAVLNLAGTYRQSDLTVFASSAAKPVEELIEMGGRWRWCETSKSPVMVDGKVVGMVGYARDITGRKAAEAEIAESQNLLRAVVDTVPVRIFWKDRDIVYLGCNEAFARDAGMRNSREIIGKDDYQMAWADQAESHRATDRDVIESGLARLSFEQQQTIAGGAMQRLRMSIVPLKNQENEIIGVLGMYEDIAEAR